MRSIDFDKAQNAMSKRKLSLRSVVSTNNQRVKDFLANYVSSDITGAFHDAVDQGDSEVVSVLLDNGYKPQKNCCLLQRAICSGNVEVFAMLEHALSPSVGDLVSVSRYALYNDKSFFAYIIKHSQSFRAIERLLFEEQTVELARIVIDNVGKMFPKCTALALQILISEGAKEDIERIRSTIAQQAVDCEQLLQRALQRENEDLVKILCPQKPGRKSLEIAVCTGNMRMVSLLVKRRDYPKRDLKKAKKVAIKHQFNDIAHQLDVVSR
jgi:hypothetical protein